MSKIVSVPDNAAILTEQLGTKPKFWYRDDASRSCLFKEARPNTGEDWSEKVAAELCELLGLPHATYELACWRGKRGVVTPTFIPSGGRLVLGNELLARLFEDYPARKLFRNRKHTLRLVIKIIRHGDIRLPTDWNGFAGVDSAGGVFVGYLMLDAWIANQDRHHENWALVIDSRSEVHLAPSYDHASSLGTNESDESRKDRLTTRDKGRSMERYVARAASAFFASTSSRKPLSTLDAFREAARILPEAAEAWLERLRQVSSSNTRALLERVPPDRISEVAIDFAHRILYLNRRRLLALEDQ